MHLSGRPEEIMVAVAREHPGVGEALALARATVPVSKREIAEYQAACLYALARPLDYKGARILEIGTAFGYSAAVMALAAPSAYLFTLNPKGREVTQARQNLARFKRVAVIEDTSHNFLTNFHRRPFDLIFVDGAHDYEHIRHDLGFWRLLRPGGLLLFHDYSPEKSGRPSADVFRAVNEFWRARHWAPDVVVIDDRQVGMAGWRRREGE